MSDPLQQAAAAPNPAATGGRRGVPFDGEMTVLSRTTAAEGVVSLELGLPGGAALPSWAPGAHIDLALGNGLTRQYSLCGSVGNRASWRVAVLREQASRGGSAWIHANVNAGTRLRVRGPRNNFPLLPASRYVFIAGGIGITPLLSMVAEAHASGADWAVHYGGRARARMAFIAELGSYGGRVALAPRDEGARLDLASILRVPAVPTLVYCCGPSPLLEAAAAHCRAWPGNPLHVERFAADPVGSQDNLPIEVELRASGMTIAVPPELSVLQAVENAGVYVLSSCAEGACGSCETTVLEGEVDHRDSVLGEDERAAGDTMMICVSRAKSGRLVLDL